MSARYVDVCAVLILFGSLQTHTAYSIVPGLKDEVYQKGGDINIGFLVNVHKHGHAEFCSEDHWPRSAQVTEIPAYMTQLINSDSTLLPNITLGFVVFDGCSKDLTALGRSLSFIPTRADARGQQHEWPNLDVVGIVGPDTSRQAVMVASLLGLFQLPVLSPYATSDELSDKGRFPYFMRMVPPDAYQAVAVVDIIEHFSWTYISMLYSEGSYGENAAKHIERLTKQRGICIAVSEMVSSDAGDEEMNATINRLHTKKKARVVILFLESNSLDTLFSNAMITSKLKHCIWISGDTFLGIRGSSMERITSGALYIDHKVTPMPGFWSHVLEQAWLNSSNPWMPLIYQSIYGCTWNTDKIQTSTNCSEYTTLNGASESQLLSPSKQADALLVYARALHSLINDNCPEHFKKPNSGDIRSCVNGSSLLQYMYNVSFTGYTGPVTFSSKGDVQGNYAILQYRWDEENGYHSVPVGEWNKIMNSLQFNKSVLDWGSTNNLARGKLQSKCSDPCKTGEYLKHQEVACCWECVKCRSNEITNKDKTNCEACPNYAWPDSTTRSVCHHIEPFYLESSSPTGTTLLCLSILGMVVALTFIIMYISQYEHPVIVATCKELSIFILCGCILACCSSMLYITHPSNIRCAIRQAGFHLSVCAMYSPLMTKACRVYRIFHASNKGFDRPGLVSNKAQLLFASMIILLQVLIIKF